jgi:ABC-2 type transport system permease protein
MSPRRFLVSTRAQLRMIFRNRVALFWSLLFPMILMTLLGLLFGRSSSGGTVTVVDQARTPVSAQVVHLLDANKGIDLKHAASVAQARKQVHDGDADGALLLRLRRGPGGPVQATLLYSNTSLEQAGIVRGIVSGTADAVSIRASGRPAAVAFDARSVESTQLSYVDFLMPGIIAISIMISSVYAVATTLVDWRKRGILRRLRLTPVPLPEFLASRVTASLFVTLMQLGVLLLFGRVAFGVSIAATAWAAIPVALAGALCFLALGFMIGSVVGSAETADAVLNVITNPMMFLSGTFVPISILPAVLASIAHLLPLYYLATGLRDTTVRGLTLGHVAGDVAVLAGIALVFALVSLRLFRWEPEPA